MTTPGSRLPAALGWGLLSAALAALALAASPPAAAAAGTGPSLGQSLKLDRVTVTPDRNRVGETFTVRAHTVNESAQPWRGLHVFLAVQPDPTHKRPPQVDQVESSAPFDLAPGEEQSVWVRFKISSVGQERYGVQLETSDVSQGLAVAFAPRPHATAPAIVPDLTELPLVPLALGVAGALLIVALAVQRLGAIPLVIGAGALVLAMTWTSLTGALGARLPAHLGLALGALALPLRWLVPPVVAIVLGLSRAWWPCAVVLFPLAYLVGAANLVGQAPAASVLSAVWPAAIVVLLFAGVRLWRHVAILARPMTVGAAFAYLAAALPWFQLYLSSVR